LLLIQCRTYNTIRNITILSPVVHIGDKAEEELPQEGDGLLCLSGDHSHAGLEAVPDSCLPTFISKYYEKYHGMSPVVHISDKAIEELPQEGDRLPCLGGDHLNAGLKAIPVSLPPPPPSYHTMRESPKVTCSPHWRQDRRRTASGGKRTSLSGWRQPDCWTCGYPRLTAPSPFLITYYERIMYATRISYVTCSRQGDKAEKELPQEGDGLLCLGWRPLACWT
jgi:hypothetical protein